MNSLFDEEARHIARSTMYQVATLARLLHNENTVTLLTVITQETPIHPNVTRCMHNMLRLAVVQQQIEEQMDTVASLPVKSREDQVLEAYIVAIEDSKALDFPQGPGISLIQFSRFLALAETINLNFDGKRCMDFGCGATRPIMIASIMYLFGASDVVAIDVTEPYKNQAAMAKGLWCMLAAFLLDGSGLQRYSAYNSKRLKSRVANFDMDALKQGLLQEALPEAIHHRIGDYLDLESELGTFDIVVSNSVFEHIQDIEGTLQCFRKNLAPDGVLYTDIDYRDHRAYGSKLSPWQYLLDDSDVSPGYINKLRHSAMRKVIREAGFQVIAEEQTISRPTSDIILNIHPRYQGIDDMDLNVAQDMLLLRINPCASSGGTP